MEMSFDNMAHAVQIPKYGQIRAESRLCAPFRLHLMFPSGPSCSKGGQHYPLDNSIGLREGRVGVREIAAGVNLATPVYGDKPGSKLD